MATGISVFPPAKERSTQVSLGATTASGDIIIGSSDSATIFVITADQKVTIRFGNSANIGNADATDFPIFSGAYLQFQLPTGCDRFRLFNTAGAASLTNYWQLARY